MSEPAPNSPSDRSLRIAVARDDQIDLVYRESHALWGAGLAYADYRELWNELSQTPWGSKHTRFLVSTDESGELLSSLKLYRPMLQLCGESSRATVIGAVFTPKAQRCRGHAAALVGHVVRRGRRRGDRLALLYSDIGTEFYESLGFRALPAEEQWGRLRRTELPRGDWELREALPEDREPIRRAHAAYCDRRPLAVIRDAEHWSYLGVRSNGFFGRLGTVGLCERRQVALHEGRFAGYLVAVEGAGEWNIREVGALDGDPRRMAAILRLGASRARRNGLRRCHGWLPPEVKPHLADWRLSDRKRRRAIPMLLRLDGASHPSALDVPGAAFLPFHDQF